MPIKHKWPSAPRETKMNDNHGPDGKFSSSDSAASSATPGKVTSVGKGAFVHETHESLPKGAWLDKLVGGDHNSKQNRLTIRQLHADHPGSNFHLAPLAAPKTDVYGKPLTHGIFVSKRK
jgi:hypothetical protein